MLISFSCSALAAEGDTVEDAWNDGYQKITLSDQICKDFNDGLLAVWNELGELGAGLYSLVSQSIGELGDIWQSIIDIFKDENVVAYDTNYGYFFPVPSAVWNYSGISNYTCNSHYTPGYSDREYVPVVIFSANANSSTANIGFEYKLDTIIPLGTVRYARYMTGINLASSSTQTFVSNTTYNVTSVRTAYELRNNIPFRSSTAYGVTGTTFSGSYTQGVYVIPTAGDIHYEYTYNSNFRVANVFHLTGRQVGGPAVGNNSPNAIGVISVSDDDLTFTLPGLGSRTFNSYRYDYQNSTYYFDDGSKLVITNDNCIFYDNDGNVYTFDFVQEIPSGDDPSGGDEPSHDYGPILTTIVNILNKIAKLIEGLELTQEITQNITVVGDGDKEVTLDIPDIIGKFDFIYAIHDIIEDMIYQLDADAGMAQMISAGEAHTYYDADTGILMVESTVEVTAPTYFVAEARSTIPSMTVALGDAESHYGYNYGGNVSALSLEWYAPYKTNVDTLVSGFLWLIFLWNVFKSVPAILGGVGLAESRAGDVLEAYGYTSKHGSKARKGE